MYISVFLSIFDRTLTCFSFSALFFLLSTARYFNCLGERFDDRRRRRRRREMDMHIHLYETSSFLVRQIDRFSSLLLLLYCSVRHADGLTLERIDERWWKNGQLNKHRARWLVHQRYVSDESSRIFLPLARRQMNMGKGPATTAVTDQDRSR